ADGQAVKLRVNLLRVSSLECCDLSRELPDRVVGMFSGKLRKSRVDPFGGKLTAFSRHVQTKVRSQRARLDLDGADLYQHPLRVAPDGEQVDSMAVEVGVIDLVATRPEILAHERLPELPQ